ncbi:MAG TPA: hypothetical protein VFI02_03925, partial [Armatimonadota bacterium]|nr:hypothetical protein [Armatimonadota bacterium]
GGFGPGILVARSVDRMESRQDGVLSMKEGIIIIAVLVALLVWEKVQRIVEARRWAGERRDLLDRLMARNFDEYVEYRQSEVGGRQSVVRPSTNSGQETAEAEEREEDMEACRAEDEAIRELASKAEAGYQNFVGAVGGRVES